MHHSVQRPWADTARHYKTSENKDQDSCTHVDYHGSQKASDSYRLEEGQRLQVRYLSVLILINGV